MSNTDMHDVAIVGAGPAGATAAILLAQKEYDVVLIDREPLPRSVARLGWLNTRAMPMLKEMGVKPKSGAYSKISDVAFVNADFSKSTQPVFDEIPGYLVDRLQFADALTQRARKSGAKVYGEQLVGEIALKEDCVEIAMEPGPSIKSKLLLLAAGSDTRFLDRLGFASQPGAAAYWTAQVNATLPEKLAGNSAKLTAVLGLDKAGSFGVVCTSRDQVSVTLSWLMGQEDVVSSLIVLCKSAFAHKIIPVDLSGEAVRVKAVKSPASVALDLDTHVGKHTLLIGDAGGFVAAASNEGVFPAMWSAQIAAEVVGKALATKHSQDELMGYDTAWRMQMADYLRSPNTDPQFLLPLVFSNQAMANRMGAAFFNGENI